MLATAFSHGTALRIVDDAPELAWHIEREIERLSAHA